MRRRRRTRTPRTTRAIGAAVLCAFALAVALIYAKPNFFPSGHLARMMFATVQGLGVVGRDVEVAGTPVGTIVSVQRSGDAALVTVRLEPGVVVHTDASAQLRPHLPFEGTAYIDLQPGSREAPALGSRTLPLSHTQVYVPVFHALSAFGPATRAATRVDVGALAATFAGAGAAGVRRTLATAPALTATLAPAAAAAAGPHGTELAEAITGLAQTFRALESQQQHLEPLIADGAVTLRALGSQQGAPLARALAVLPPALQELHHGSDALSAIVARLTPLAGELLPGLRRLPGTLAATEPLLVSATPVLRDAPPLLANLERALAAGRRSAPVTIGLLAALSPSLTLLRDSLLPALLGPTAKLHIPAYLSFFNLFEGGGGASAPFQTPAQASMPGQTGVGHFMRFGARFFSGVGAPLPPCTLVAKVSTQLASELAQDGVCQS
jgi:ABC-type transporter Mla subunit MlaD